MTLRVNSLTGFGGGGGGVAIVGSVLGNKSTTRETVHALGSIDVGSASGDKNIILGVNWSDDTSRTISSLTVGGVGLTQRAFIETAGDDTGAALYSGDISSISGSQAIVVTFDALTDSASVSAVAVSGLQSLVPTMTDTDSRGTAGQLVLTNLAAPGNGIAFACGACIVGTATATWGSLTERVDVQVTSPGNDHRHTAAWDLGGRGAANETLDFTSGSFLAVAGGGFR